MGAGWLAFLSAILVAIIGGPLMWLLHRFDRHNTLQHGENLAELKKISHTTKVIDDRTARLEDRLDSHLEWHAEVGDERKAP